MAEERQNLIQEFRKGLWAENAVFKQLLGMCPTLAVTNAAINGFSMGAATLFVLVCSSVVVSLIKSLIPKEVRIAAYIVIIASFVTIIDLTLAAFFPAISKALGPYVPLIVVNCVILGRQESFSSKNTTRASFMDGLGMGLGFTWALTLLGSIRELLGFGSIFGVGILSLWSGYEPWIIMLLPPGAFLTLGLLLGGFNAAISRRRKAQVARVVA